MHGESGRDIAPGEDGTLAPCRTEELGNLDEFITLRRGHFIFEEDAYVVHKILYGAALTIRRIEVWRRGFLQAEAPRLLGHCSGPTHCGLGRDVGLFPLQPFDPKIDT